VDVASFVSSIFNGQLPFRVEAFDGSSATPSVVSPANNITLKILKRDALVRFISRPGELGLARAFVAGDIDVDGDLDALFSLQVPPLRQILTLANVRGLASEVVPQPLGDYLHLRSKPGNAAHCTVARATRTPSRTTTTSRIVSTRWSLVHR